MHLVLYLYYAMGVSNYWQLRFVMKYQLLYFVIMGCLVTNCVAMVVVEG